MFMVVVANVKALGPIPMTQANTGSKIKHLNTCETLQLVQVFSYNMKID